jgi:hypothetical protein
VESKKVDTCVNIDYYNRYLQKTFSPALQLLFMLHTQASNKHLSPGFTTKTFNKPCEKLLKCAQFVFIIDFTVYLDCIWLFFRGKRVCEWNVIGGLIVGMSAIDDYNIKRTFVQEWK